MNENFTNSKLKVVPVNRTELILPESSLSTFLLESYNNGFTRRSDSYDDVYLVLPWTAQKENLGDYVKLVFEFSGNQDDFEAWLKKAAIPFGIIFHNITTARRVSIGSVQKPGPNPNKWSNKKWPATRDYPTNLANAFRYLNSKRVGSKCLEVNCPLSTDDLGQMCASILESFPKMRLVEISQGYEHAIYSKAGTEMNLATARLLFDISDFQERDYHAIFANVESIHSFIVPVMRIFSEPSVNKLKNVQWGL